MLRLTCLLVYLFAVCIVCKVVSYNNPCLPLYNLLLLSLSILVILNRVLFHYYKKYKSFSRDFLGHREIIQATFRGWQILWVKELGTLLDDFLVHSFVMPRLDMIYGKASSHVHRLAIHTSSFMIKGTLQN